MCVMAVEASVVESLRAKFEAVLPASGRAAAPAVAGGGGGRAGPGRDHGGGRGDRGASGHGRQGGAGTGGRRGAVGAGARARRRPQAGRRDRPGAAAGAAGAGRAETRGDPESPLVWTTKSTRNLADALTARRASGVGPDGGPDAARAGVQPAGQRQGIEGRQHPDRDAQFGYLNAQVVEHLAAGAPVISVDTKKKELVGRVQERRPRVAARRVQPVRVNVHDFPDPELGKAIPYGIYDVAANTGWVSASAPTTTPPRSRSRRSAAGGTPSAEHRYPDADRLLIYRRRRRLQRLPDPAWKIELAALRRRDRPDDHRLPPAAGHQQMEQDRAPAVLPHHHELARPAPDQPPESSSTSSPPPPPAPG